ncbi:MAG TPA: protein phosphatase CheZ [Dissulfurispiraceae bacterium]|nr:protein phosphatase CheZ [Dissulfurispiraceae bacterium]
MQYIGFLMNGNEYTIPILKVQEIVNLPSVTKLPQASDYLEGVTNLRGKIIPIINLKKMVGLPSETAGEKVIVISSGRITFGVLVDGITGVISIEENEIEPAENFMNTQVEQVEGVARLNDRLVVLLDTRKLIPLEDIEMFEDKVFEVKEAGDDKVEVVKSVQGMGGQMFVTEVVDAKDFFEKKSISAAGDPKQEVYGKVMAFMDAVATQNYEKADELIQGIAQLGQAGQGQGQGTAQAELFKEVGKVTRKLHDSIKSFKEALDPRLKDMAMTEMPSAIDKLQFVIEKTEEAANKTMGIVEKYILVMDDLSAHIRNVKEPPEAAEYLKKFKNELEDDFTEILTTQSFQDLTGQTLKKVITLVGDIEEELVGLIATFGVKSDQGDGVEPAKVESVSQEGVDDLLKEFGF